MPREVFAEEIERFLGMLDGVAAARVSTTQSGDVAQVYVTAEPAADTHAVRRGVGAALVSTYGIPVDPWRIQVAQPRAASRFADLPRFRVVCVEEAVSGSETTVTVRLAWPHGGEDRVATGRARSDAGAAHRLRALAAAAADAARDALRPEHRRVAVEEAALVTMLDRPAVAVALSIATPGGPETSLGIAQEDTVSDAAVAAVLDAVTKWMARAAEAAAGPGEDRGAALERMRRHLRAAEHGVVARPAADGESERGRTAVPAVGRGGRPGAAPAAEAPDPDVVRDVREIRPGAPPPAEA